MGFLLLLSFSVVICWPGMNGQSYDNMTSLISSVLSGYNSYVKPMSNQSDIMHINLSMYIYNILEVDTVQGVLTFVASLPSSWHDERITWNPAHYEGITSIKIQQQYVWTPPIASSKPVEFDNLGDKWMTVTYQYDGKASWNPGGVYKVTCPMNLKYWPFDTHQCVLGYFLANYMDSEALLKPEKFETLYFTENGEWSLDSTHLSSEIRFESTEVIFNITLSRKPRFFIETLIMPLTELSFLSIFVFLLPNESGERVSYCITILLALILFLDVIADEIPKISNPLPAICKFLLVAVIMNGVITVVVICNLILFNRSSDVPIPNYYQTLVRAVRRLKNKSPTTQKEDNDIQQHGPTNQHTLAEKTPPLKQPSETPLDTDSSKPQPSVTACHRNESEITWQDVSRTLDVIYFILFFTGSVILIITMTLTLSLETKI